MITTKQKEILTRFAKEISVITSSENKIVELILELVEHTDPDLLTEEEGDLLEEIGLSLDSVISDIKDVGRMVEQLRNK